MAEASEKERIIEAAQRWMAGDPEPETRAELERLIAAGDLRELRERMNGSLEFGTAGLRAVVGAGPMRMNRAVIIRTSRGLAEYLRSRGADARTLPVVVGYDGRLTSRQYAEDTIGVLLAAGIPVRFFDFPVPTPVVAYAARQLGAQSAVIVTASHNPPEYNGYKVYADNAIQIVSPVDQQVAARIEQVGAANQVPLVQHVFEGNAQGPGTATAERIPDSLIERYYAELDALRPRTPGDRDLSIVYTPLHGVGFRFVEQALRRAGYLNFRVVRAQAEPDGNFPTVRFPNPEEPGALDLAFEEARAAKADLVLANDPDADRLSVAVPTVTGRWQLLTGNQIGLLLADYVLQHAPKSPTPLVLSSIVSSPMLYAIANEYGAKCDQTLTGFKWVWNAALDLESQGGCRFVFGYEEALGYSVGHLVRDKDGVSAAVLFADIAAECKARNSSVLERLEALYRKHGLWVSLQKSVTLPGSDGVSKIKAAMQRIAEAPPERLGGRQVLGFVDYRRGAEQRPRYLGAASLFELKLDGGSRVLVRPSGTEPKLKIYVDLRVDVAEGKTVHGSEDAANQLAAHIAEEVVQSVGLA